MSNDKNTVGYRLQSLLTADQILVLLNVLAKAGYLEGVDSQLCAVDPDLADTVRRILGEPAASAEVGPSDQKTIEIWNSLWDVWCGHVSDVGEEDGVYVNHEEHWHPPYFDLSVVEGDLEEASEELSKWIDQAYPLKAI